MPSDIPPLPKQTITEQARVYRPNLFEALGPEMTLGPSPSYPHVQILPLVEDVLSKNSPWKETYGKGTKSLRDNLRATDPWKRATAKVLLSELNALNSMKSDERTELIKKIEANSKLLKEIRIHVQSIRGTRISRVSGSTELQHAIGFHSSLCNDLKDLDYTPLLFERKSIVAVLNTEKDQSTKVALTKLKADVEQLIAIRFIELARHAYRSLQNDSYYNAEKFLKEALALRVPEEAWDLEENREFRKDVESEYYNLYAKNNLPELFEDYCAKLDTNKDTALNDQEIKAAQPKGDKKMVAFIDVLKDLYQDLTRFHIPFITKNGINRADVETYDKDRKNHANDLKI